MSSFQNSDIFSYFEQHPSREDVVILSEDVFNSLTEEQIEAITASKYSQSRLFQLPNHEITFFEWLKEKDRAVWDDLWAEESGETVYAVSLSFLPLLKDISRGFPICDLRTVDNYYFVPEHLVAEERPIVIDAIKERVFVNKSITTEQLLCLEISYGGIDIWHFAYHHSVDLDRAKKAVIALVEDTQLLWIKNSDDLAPYIK